MAKNKKPTRDEQEKADMEKMQKRVESMLPAKADIPASISIQQAEELKARISELEAKIAEQQPDIVQRNPLPLQRSSLRNPCRSSRQGRQLLSAKKRFQMKKLKNRSHCGWQEFSP